MLRMQLLTLQLKFAILLLWLRMQLYSKQLDMQRKERYAHESSPMCCGRYS